MPARRPGSQLKIAVDVIRALLAPPPGRTIREVAESVGYSKYAVYRVVAQLEELGCVVRVEQVVHPRGSAPLRPGEPNWSRFYRLTTVDVINWLNPNI